MVKGNLDQFDVAAYKRKLVQTLQAFIAFCEANQLQYMASAGTCIGAVRHHGIIPWDDDIDVFMSRAEYNRLLTLRGDLPEGYALVLMGEQGYYAPITKFYDTNTTLWEEKSLPCTIGVYIDIFVIDECDSDAEMCNRVKKQYESIYLNYMDSHRTWLLEDFLEKITSLHPLGFIRLCKNTFYHRLFQRRYKRQYDEIYRQMLAMKGNNVMPWDGMFASAYPKHYFEKTVGCEFEGLIIQIPAAYDEYLSQTYHNYMQFPPENKRISTHSHFYLNLEKGMTIEEVKEELGMK